MSVSVVQRPIGFVLSTTEVTHKDVSNSSGDALVTSPSHGLTTGDYVFIKSPVKNYNGFWYVVVINTNTFKIRSAPTATNQEYLSNVSAELSYWEAESTHNWNAVHLPIVYKLTNNKWPTNQQDPSRTVLAFRNEDGFTNITLNTGSLGLFLDVLEFVSITGAASEEVNGVWQVTDITSSVAPTAFTFNLAYKDSYDFTGAQVQYYYNNYHVNVKIYAGLKSTHLLEDLKPYELLAEVSLIPNENNEIIFSVSEILKEHINTRNELLLPGLPNNLDFMTMFYIGYSEAYDHNNYYTLAEFETPFTSDKNNFEGFAVNAKLLFKNRYSGQMSEYVSGVNSSAKFLTLFNQPTLFSESYQDVSFIADDFISLKLRQTYYSAGSQIAQNDSAVVDFDGGGLYRKKLESNCSADQVKIKLIDGTIPQPSLSEYRNLTVTANFDWTTGSAPQVIMGSTGVSEVLGVRYPLNPGTHNFAHVSVTCNGLNVDLRFGLASSDLSYQPYVLNSLAIGTNDFVNASLVTTQATEYIFFEASNLSAGSRTVQVTIVEMDDEERVISEEKTFDINCACANQSIFLTWLNNLGGFDYWLFTAEKDRIIDVGDTQETKKDIFNEWPNSYGEFSDTIRQEVSRDSRHQILVRSQNVSLENLEALIFIKSSILVQVIESRYDKRTVIVDKDSFTWRKEGDKLFSISFIITYTDDIPVQSL